MLETYSNCPICKQEVELIEIQLPLFRHLDFSTIPNVTTFLKCTYCQIISNPSVINSELSNFEGEQYAVSSQTDQIISVDGYPEPLLRSFLQAKLLVDRYFTANQNIRILDIGCFDGRLLIELDKLLVNADLWGFDINTHLNSVFPKKNNFNFLATSLDDIRVSFDLIILSHSIFYIHDQNDLMSQIYRLLKNDGILFIQIPDIKKSPYYSLMGDQYYIFTQTSLINFLGYFGYITEKIYNDYFPKELLVAAKKNRGSYVNCLEDDSFLQNIKILLDTKVKLDCISFENISVLGTTVNAAFVDEILNEKVLYFIDEKPSKTGKIFRGKKVLHPKEISEKNHTILPYGELGNKIRARFERNFEGTFTVM